MAIYQLDDSLRFPLPELAREDGLLAVGGDLRPQRLLLAYAHGIFPWYDEESPILWWSPDPRTVIFPERFHASRRLQRTLRQGKFRFTADAAFDQVVAACAAPQGEDRETTWIIPEMQEAYIRLHKLGYAHSIEAWYAGELAGGVYGVSLGACFFGESMFTRVRDASKCALATLVKFALDRRFRFIDCQNPTAHLHSLGAQDIPRARYLAMLAEAVQEKTTPGLWRLTAKP
jgi:leucyl/phenylalanyl-tRNA--protein transferase